MDSFCIGDRITLISHSGEEKYAIIQSITGFTIELKFLDIYSIKSFVVDSIDKKLSMIGCSTSIFTYEILKYDDELLLNLLNSETVESTVRRIIGRAELECECETCIGNEIEFLELLVDNFPDTIHHNVASLYIRTQMIPNLRNEILISRITDYINENIGDIIERSFDEEQDLDRTISTKDLENIMSSKKSFDCKVNSCEDNCLFCFDEFSKMKGKVDFIECPNCYSKFCPGTLDMSSECCRGLKYHLQNDNRCPVCRISAPDWVKKLNEIKKIQQVLYKKTDFSIEDFIEKPIIEKKFYKMKSKKIIPKKIKRRSHYHKEYSKRQIYGKMR